MASSSARNELRPVWALGFPGTLGTALSITAFWERPVRVRSSGLGPKGGPRLCWAARKAPAAAAAAAVALVPGASGSPPGGTRLGDPPLLSGSRPLALPRRAAPSRGWDEQVTRECCGRSQRESEPGKVLGRRVERDRLRDLGEGCTGEFPELRLV